MNIIIFSIQLNCPYFKTNFKVPIHTITIQQTYFTHSSVHKYL